MNISIVNLLFKYIQDNHGLKTNRDVANFLGMKEETLSVYRSTEPKSKAIMSMILRLIQAETKKAKLNLTSINITKIMQDYIQEEQKNINQQELANLLGISISTLKNYLISNTNNEIATRKMVTQYFNKLHQKKASEFVKTIVEYKRINPKKVNTTYKLRLNPDKKDEMEKVLTGRKGIYIFYNSSGEPLYIGKAEKNDLYLEVCQRLAGKTVEIIGEDCKRKKIEQGEIAQFISVYEIENAYIAKLEALLIRACASVIKNKKIENI